MKINYCGLIDREIDPVHCAYWAKIGEKTGCAHPCSPSSLCYIAEPGPEHSIEFMKELDHDRPFNSPARPTKNCGTISQSQPKCTQGMQLEQLAIKLSGKSPIMLTDEDMVRAEKELNAQRNKVVRIPFLGSL